MDFKTQVSQKEKIPLFTGNEKLKGRVEIKLDRRRKVDHLGIKLELVGAIEVNNVKVLASNFMCNANDLEPSGTLYNDMSYDFQFDVFQKPYESYYGDSCKLRYFLRCSITTGTFQSNYVKEKEIGVQKERDQEDDEELEPKEINMEVGIEDYLNIKMHFPTNIYSMTGKSN